MTKSIEEIAREAKALAEAIPPRPYEAEAHCCDFAGEKPGSACGIDGMSYDGSPDKCHHTLHLDEALVFAHALNHYGALASEVLRLRKLVAEMESAPR